MKMNPIAADFLFDDIVFIFFGRYHKGRAFRYNLFWLVEMNKIENYLNQKRISSSIPNAKQKFNKE